MKRCGDGGEGDWAKIIWALFEKQNDTSEKFACSGREEPAEQKRRQAKAKCPNIRNGVLCIYTYAS